MRTFLLLVLACVVVTESKADAVKTLLLKECIDSTNSIIHNNSDKILNQMWVKDVFSNQECSVETPCRTAAALKHAHHGDLQKLRRQLYAYAVYTGHQNCNVTNTDERLIKDVLKELKKCCQTFLLQQ